MLERNSICNSSWSPVDSTALLGRKPSVRLLFCRRPHGYFSLQHIRLSRPTIIKRRVLVRDIYRPKPSGFLTTSGATTETGTSNEQTRSSLANPSMDTRRSPTNPTPSFVGSNTSRMYADFAGSTSKDVGSRVRQSHETVHRETWTRAFDELRISIIWETGIESDRTRPKSANEANTIGILVSGGVIALTGVIGGDSREVLEQPCSADAVINAMTSLRSKAWRWFFTCIP